MNGSSEGDEFCNGNIDEMDEKLKSMSLDGDGGHDEDEEEEDDDDNDDECNSNSDRGQSSLSQVNYYDEPPHQLNNLNHLFHIDFMRSMQNLRSQDKRFLCQYWIRMKSNIFTQFQSIFFRVNLDLNMERDAVAHSPMTKCDKLNVKIKYYWIKF